MSRYVKSLVARGLYGRFDLQQEFYPGVNVLYGENGSGKSTLLQILANALNGDYERFIHLPFDSIRIELDDGVVILLNQTFKRSSRLHVLVNGTPISKFDHRPEIKVEILKKGEDEMGNVEALLPALYFPPFRDVIDAWYLSLKEENTPSYLYFSRGDVYHFARRLFGKFVPKLEAALPIDGSKSIYNGKSTLLLSYLITVNRFLSGKKLVYQSKQLKVKFEDDDHYEGFESLSLGERHLITMLYAASQTSKNQLILIDEPEQSLHLDWQERLLAEMMALDESCQLIVCTHSPMIGVEYEDRMREVMLTPAQKVVAYREKVPA